MSTIGNSNENANQNEELTKCEREKLFLEAEKLKQNGLSEDAVLIYFQCIKNLTNNTIFPSLPKCLKSLALYFFEKGNYTTSVQLINILNQYYTAALSETQRINLKISEYMKCFENNEITKTMALDNDLSSSERDKDICEMTESDLCQLTNLFSYKPEIDDSNSLIDKTPKSYGDEFLSSLYSQLQNKSYNDQDAAKQLVMNNLTSFNTNSKETDKPSSILPIGDDNSTNHLVTPSNFDTHADATVSPNSISATRNEGDLPLDKSESFNENLSYDPTKNVLRNLIILTLFISIILFLTTAFLQYIEIYWIRNKPVAYVSKTDNVKGEIINFSLFRQIFHSIFQTNDSVLPEEKDFLNFEH